VRLVVSRSKARLQTPEQVKNKLIKAGVAEDIAARASMGAGKKGQAAYDFVQQNKDLLKLTDEQQKSLFVDRYLQKKNEFLGKFDADTYRNMNKDQFTALMSLHYNTPAFIQNDTGIQRAIRNKSDPTIIAAEIKKWNKVGKDKIHPVLDARRKAEADLYLGGNQ
jgi:GH24 family phage-related lysozyme (muramidase)